MSKTETKDLVKIILDAAFDKKAEEIVSIDLAKVLTRFCDTFIICHAQSTVHVQSIADGIYRKVKKELSQSPSSYEGYENANWILLDYLDVVVHIFQEPFRMHYQLEKLWADGQLKEHKLELPVVKKVEKKEKAPVKKKASPMTMKTKPAAEFNSATVKKVKTPMKIASLKETEDTKKVAVKKTKTPEVKVVAAKAAVVKKQVAAAKVKAPVKKAVPVKDTAVKKKVVVSKEKAPAKKVAPVKKATPAKKVAPAKKATVVKKAIPTKKAPAAKKVTKRLK